MSASQGIQVQKAVEILNQGSVVGLPTETVYGLAGRIDSEPALRKIFETKKRPFFDPLIVHVSKVSMAKEYVQEWPHEAELLAKNFWPGPLSIILKKNEKVSDLITASFETVALRCPDQDLFRKIIDTCSCPLAAPSANRFGKTSPTSAKDVEREFDSKVFVVDGGDCQVGIESTVLSVGEKIEIHRSGSIGLSQIQDLFPNKEVVFKRSGDSPGQLKAHYQPDKQLFLVTESEFENQSRDFSKGEELVLSPDASIAARELYRNMRAAANSSKDFIYFIKKETHESESWRAIRDRLDRASS